jgi:hypothetical protein
MNEWMNPTIGSLTSGWKQNNQSDYWFIQTSSDTFSCCWAVARKLAARTVRGTQYFRILKFSQGKHVFFEKSRTICSTYDFGSVSRDQTGTCREAKNAQSRSHSF